jgi:hypothetical protein
MVVGALHGVGNVQTSQKLLGDGFHSGFIVKRRGQGVDGNAHDSKFSAKITLFLLKPKELRKK